MGIPDSLMNIMSCHEFVKYLIQAFIPTCYNALVTYYLSKVFVVVEMEVSGVDNTLIIVKNKTNDTHLHEEESILTCKAAIP